MIRIISVLLLMSACTAIIHAADETIINYAKGPVKQIIIANNYDNYDNGFSNLKVRMQIYTYDTLGRLKDEVRYDDQKFRYRYVYKYSDNICMKYESGPKKIIKGNYCRMRMDSKGNQITSETYIKGKFFIADSTVYDESGHKTEYYETRDKQLNYSLKYTYEYDSLGRISKTRSILYGKGMVICSVEYQPDGNFTEYHTDVKGHKMEYNYFVNDKGQLVEVKWTNSERTIYSEFDQYGNWIESQRIVPNEGIIVTKRIIEYYK